jgi:5-methylcytosine-specific restriction endonuclease McrA
VPKSKEEWFEVTADAAQIAREREKARKLRKSQWWRDRLNQGLCHYCGRKFAAGQLTMDHIVPLARGGLSTHGNIVASCKECNTKKKLATPVERLLEELEKGRGGGSGEDS